MGENYDLKGCEKGRQIHLTRVADCLTLLEGALVGVQKGLTFRCTL